MRILVIAACGGVASLILSAIIPDLSLGWHFATGLVVGQIGVMIWPS